MRIWDHSWNVSLDTGAGATIPFLQLLSSREHLLSLRTLEAQISNTFKVTLSHFIFQGNTTALSSYALLIHMYLASSLFAVFAI